MQHRHYAALEYENRLMLERLALVMQKKTIDNDEPTKKANNRSRAQREELRRINRENKLILRRILEASPQYDHKKWDEEARQREKYIANICEFPPEKTVSAIKSQPWMIAMASANSRPSSPARTRPMTSSGALRAARPISSPGARRPLSAVGIRTIKSRPISAVSASKLANDPAVGKRPASAVVRGRLRV